jgi:hypothetical protein
MIEKYWKLDPKNLNRANANYEDLKHGRYAMKLDSMALSNKAPSDSKATGIANLDVIKNWTQFSTKDRVMMTGPVLERLSNAILKDMRDGKSVYVHCKSGKGRSASGVVGARASYVIDDLIRQKLTLEPKDIDLILERQIADVEGARKMPDGTPIAKISEPQKVNLKSVLYQRAADAQKKLSK